MGFRGVLFFMPSIINLTALATRFSRLVAALSQMAAPVAITSVKSLRNVCESPKTAVSLRCDSEQYMYNNKSFKIMTQNFMSARALTMEELENVNGGIRVKSNGGETDPRKKTFEVRV